MSGGEAVEPLAAPPTFHRLLGEQRIELEDGDEGRLGRYLAMLLEASRQFNLTAIRDPDEAWVRHIFDALTLLPYLLGAEARLVVDVGPGGGGEGHLVNVAGPSLVLAVEVPEHSGRRVAVAISPSSGDLLLLRPPVEPAQDFLVPAHRVGGLQDPVVLVRKEHEARRHALPSKGGEQCQTLL